jgi:hypothetical protein
MISISGLCGVVDEGLTVEHFGCEFVLLNDEPILRIMSEAPAAEIAEKYCDELAAVIGA